LSLTTIDRIAPVSNRGSNVNGKTFRILRGRARVAAVLTIAIVAGLGATVSAQQIQRRVTSHPADDRTPRWSPDGSVIACSTRAFSDGAADGVVLVDAEDQAPAVPATKGPGTATFPVWAPRGDSLIWVGSPPGRSEVHLAVGAIQGKAAAFFGRGFVRLVDPDRSAATGLVVYAASQEGGGLDLWVENVPRR
jgi:Tol biopolymer transport system component